MTTGQQQERTKRREEFLRCAGIDADHLDALSPDASFRRYYRVRQDGRSWMLMDAPPDREPVAPFIAVARHLERLGIAAPVIVDADPENGLVLLDDLGDETFTRALEAGADETSLYEMAVDLLARLQNHPNALDVSLPRYDVQALMTEARLLIDWFAPEAGAAPGPVSSAGFERAWRRVFDAMPDLPPTLVLRDYHVDNLMIDGRGRCAVLDFQDALIGSPAYDLVSLVEDARRDIDAGIRTHCVDHYLELTGNTRRDAFMHHYTVLGAQRHAKVLGIFTRLCRRDGKCRYLAHLPRVAGLLLAALQHPVMEPVRLWQHEHLSGLAATAALLARTP